MKNNGKKFVTMLGLALSLTSLVACGGTEQAKAVTCVGTYGLETCVVSDMTSSYGVYIRATESEVLNLYSDNTFNLLHMRINEAAGDAINYHKSGEDYRALFHGTYEITDKNEEIGDTTVKFKTIDGLVLNDGTDLYAADADAELKTKLESRYTMIDKEFILDASLGISEFIGWCYYGY